MEATLAQDQAQRSMSLLEWAALRDDEPGEFVDGRLVEEEMPDPAHEAIVIWLGAMLRAWAHARGGIVLGSGVKFAVSAGRGRKPDLTVFVGGGAMPPRRGVVRIPPFVAVEIVSASARDERRDRIEKLDEYAAFGVRFYWIVDPELHSFEVFELGDGGRYSRALGATDGRISAVPGCEGLALDLDAMWEELARLGPEEPEA